jgi:cell wall-associated NlpC family hydrolase
VALRQRQQPYPRQSVAAVLDYARQFLGVSYLWGGTSWAGIDCSGFVQLCYRAAGYYLPRDADQQDGFLHHAIERPQMRAGDLIFFGSQQITHVALALNDHEYIHAEGQNYHRVLINSFRSGDEHYYPRLDQIVRGLKRVID